MKLASLGLTLMIFGSAAFAQAGVSVKGCYADYDKSVGAFVTEITINNDEVLVGYVQANGKGLGGFRGRTLTKPVVSADSISIQGLTLHDGGDGWLDDVKIVITKDSVTFDSKISKQGPKPRVACVTK